MKHLGFIGMSGVGKTYWSTKLHQAGFKWFNCDSLIANALNAQFSMNLQSLNDLGNWLGFPFQDSYKQQEQLFIDTEYSVLDTILNQFEQDKIKQASVIDMGGSAIYGGEKLFKKLQNYSTIIYLELAPEAYPTLLQNYLKHPSPLIWRGIDKPKSAADFEYCYTNLIQHRIQLYQQYSNITIPYSIHKQANFSAQDLLNYIHY